MSATGNLPCFLGQHNSNDPETETYWIKETRGSIFALVPHFPTRVDIETLKACERATRRLQLSRTHVQRGHFGHASVVDFSCKRYLTESA
jgi:hypothetical protein